MRIEPPTSIMQLADKTCRTLVGKVNNVLIQVGKHSFHVDFVILDIKAGPKSPLILGIPFMKTVRMLEDMDKGEVKAIIKDCEESYKEIGVT